MSGVKQERKIFRIQLFAVIAGVVVLGVKFIAYFITHSNTILSDALESIINVVAGVFALYSLYVASKPQDYDHPYGHGKIEFISAGFEGILIVLAGVLIIFKSAIAFFQPKQLEHLTLGLAIIMASGIINFILGMVLVKSGTANSSITLKADGEHLKSDAYSSFGIFAGLVLIILTNWSFMDNVVAILFGFIIIFMGIRLARKSVAGIMDEADEPVLESILQLLIRHRKAQWIDIHNLRVIRYGSKLHIDCHVTLPWYYTLEEAHREIEEIASIITDIQGLQAEFFIHEDPCIAESCSICMIADCKVRKQPFIRKIEWNEDNVRHNRKHQLKLLSK